jgi:cell filamentation protein
VAWQDPYADPGTGVLKNLLGITDQVTFDRAVAAYTTRRLRELGAKALPGGYDLAHLRAFHRYIAQDLFAWAGELRTCEVSKGTTSFRPVGNIVAYSEEVFGNLRRANYLKGGDRGQFVGHLANLLADLNALHPFRELNGRTQRAFASQLARTCGWHLAWDQVDVQRNIDASRASFVGDDGPLRELLAEIASPCPPPGSPDRTSTPRRGTGVLQRGVVDQCPRDELAQVCDAATRELRARTGRGH